MQLDAHRPRRRTLILAIAAALVLLLLTSVGIYGLLRGPASRDTPPTVPSPPSPAQDVATAPEPLPITEDAEAFARATAVALFTWDSAGEAQLTDYLQPIVDRADPDDAPALAADVRSYFPDESAWAQLRSLQVRQRIEIDSIQVPDAWATARAQARPGQLPPGATAYTVTGSRHRDGIWGTAPAADVRPVAFTIFLACPPESSCRLLRLSGVDTPLR